MISTRVVLWRHGRTSWNVEGRFQGQTDTDLDEAGIAQAERAARLLAGLGPSLLISSDLKRARATADALAAVSGLAVDTDPDLRETDGGEWEGLLATEITARDPDAYARWRAGDPYMQVGGGESRMQVGERVARAVERAARRAAGELAVLATHGGSARLGIARLIGLPPERVASLGVLSNCAWSMLSRRGEGRWVLVEHNAGTLPEPVTVPEG